jgi:hypothetical protein
MTKEWRTLVNYDIKHNDAGTKSNTSKMWATEIILLNWEFVHNCWEERNMNEHDVWGQPDGRKKEKIIEIIAGEHKKCADNKIYEDHELDPKELQRIPLENLQMIHTNIKNVREKKRKKNI